MDQELNTTTLAEFDATQLLGSPFEVCLIQAVKQKVNPNTGEVLETSIPDVEGLLNVCVASRLLNPRKLAPAEIKFIRNAKGIKAKELADSIETTPEHISRCENGVKTLSPTLEKMLRISILTDSLYEFMEDHKSDDIFDKEEQEEIWDILKFVTRVLKEMKIKAAFDTDEPLRFAFRRVLPEEGSEDNDDNGGKWKEPEAA